jgi:hypothetical protein
MISTLGEILAFDGISETARGKVGIFKLDHKKGLLKPEDRDESQPSVLYFQVKRVELEFDGRICHLIMFQEITEQVLSRKLEQEKIKTAFF